MILAGDIGGTNTRMAFFENVSGKLVLAIERDYVSRDHEGLDEIVSQFVSDVGVTVDAACFGVAGPVLGGRVSTPNLAWLVDAAALTTLVNNKTVWLINDLEAHAHSLAALVPEDFMQLNPQATNVALSPNNAAALIAPGTGLGEAGLLWNGTRHVPFASEGGHADFAPRTELEMEMLRYFLTKFKRVSYERVLAGPGVVNVYNFLRDTHKEPEPDWLREELSQAPDAARVITNNALAGKAAICERVLEIFVTVLGAEAGNLALRFMATGGVFLGGGIPPKILPRILDSGFMDAFLSKGRLSRMLEPIPVNVVMNGKSGLIGAARCALLNSESDRNTPKSQVAQTIH